ncbi:MAG: hypothetical protein E7474_13945 [Ruminococcaceae bacterium]|nr:hypothetical protein [Oscillospiraceae bacterium]
MSERMRYTDEEIAVIDGVIGFLYPRMQDESLRSSYRSVHEHLHSGSVDAADLRRIGNALAFTDPGQCTSFHKESYRDMTVLRLKTEAMLRTV